MPLPFARYFYSASGLGRLPGLTLVFAVAMWQTLPKVWMPQGPSTV